MRTAFVTGGSRGIGAQTVRRLSADGWRVGFSYLHSEEAAHALARETGAFALRADMTVSADVNAAIAEAEKRLRHIDALVNNAGVSLEKLLTDVSDEEWRYALDGNLTSAFYATRAALPGMISRKSGAIVNLSSVWGVVGASVECAYSAAKAGVIGLTKALAKELGPSGIRVNCVAPGPVQTDMLRGYDEETLASLRQQTPLGRLGTPADVAGCVAWLCGEDAAYLTGQVIMVDGGFAL